ncbi:hypothetical protein OIO90_006119 [Microbotryomycetes sp. JL221]|nr:hypothetical protein OIO90_006119 [Microbotryomycetes sp. JL221]
MSTKHILHIVTNQSHYAEDKDHPTGLWLGELTHAYDKFEAAGYKQTMASIHGGSVPIEPKSTGLGVGDKSTKAWQDDPEKMASLANTKSVTEVDAEDFDAIYFTGGHGVMYDFRNNEPLNKLTRDMWEQGKVVSSVCHGYCGLLDVKLNDGKYLIDGKKLTGFSWNEEVLAGVSKAVPYNSEEEARQRGADYSKALMPFVSNVVVDGKLVTGQNPGSATATAEKVIEVLSASA